MTEKFIDEYLNSIKAASEIVDKSKTFKLLGDARKKLYSKIKTAESESAFAKKKGNPFFEQLNCVGYYPQERRLEAVLSIKQRFGYGGPVPGGNGSMEYVAFYVNWNGDGDFNDFSEDVCASYVQVFDPANNPRPINYAVYRDIIPPPNLPEGRVVRVRAILSWNSKPTGPNFVPVWGNVVDSFIRHQSVQ